MIDDLLKQFDQIVLAYDTNVRKSVLEVIKEQCKISAKNLFNTLQPQATQPRNPEGYEVITNPKYYKRRDWWKYSSYWTYRTDGKADIVKGTIYAKKPMYKLVHLLEYGHVLKLKNGGTKMVRGFGHVEKEEKRAFDAVEKGIAEKLKHLK